MQQDGTSRVLDKKPLRSSLKASARPSPIPIASTSSSGASSSASDTFSFTRWSRRQRHIQQHPTQDACVLARTLRDCKRKAEDVDITPPDSKTATFAVPGASHVFSRLHSLYVMPR